MRKIDALFKEGFYGGFVGTKPVTRKLVFNFLVRGHGQPRDETICRFGIAFAKVMSQHQLGATLHRHKAIGIADLVISLFVLELVTLFLENESPNFVHFHIAHGNLAQLFVHEPLAFLPGLHDQAHNRVPIHAGDSFRAPDRIALK